MSNYIIIEMTFSARKSCTLPQFLGSTLRGVLGEQLLRKYCNNPRRFCKYCASIRNCMFTDFFSRLDNKRNKHLHLPTQYVIYHPQPAKTFYRQGELLIFYVKLFNNAIKYQIDVTEALIKGCDEGLSFIRYGFDFVSSKVTQGTSIDVHASFEIDAVTLTFDTPLRINTHTQGIMWKIDFELIIRNILRRLSETDILNLPADVCNDYLKKATCISTSFDHLQPWHIERYSNRTASKKSISGLVGSIAFSGTLSPFVDLLMLGEIIHIGKACSMGLGHYDLVETL